MPVIIHHNDLDGRCAAAIAFRSKFLAKHKKIEFFEMDYVRADDFDFGLIAENDVVIIVDFSFTPKKMAELMARTKDIIWIDHHKTAMEYDYAKNGTIKGIRKEGVSGCELTWLYFCKTARMPTAVKLIGDRDTWTWKYGKATAKLNEGIKIFGTSPESKLWDDMLGKEKGLDSIMSTGTVVLKYKEALCKNYCEQFGSEVMFEGIKCFAVNLYTFGSETFGEWFHKYDACVTYVFVDGKGQIGVYSKTRYISGLCSKYGGGGHPHASGFVRSSLPFIVPGGKL